MGESERWGWEVVVKWQIYFINLWDPGQFLKLNACCWHQQWVHRMCHLHLTLSFCHISSFQIVSEAKQACLPLSDIQPKDEEISIPIGTHGSTIDFFRDFLSLEVAYKLMSAISTISLCSPPDFKLAKYRYSAWYLQDRVDSIMINLGVCHNWRPCLQSTHSVFSLEIWLPVLWAVWKVPVTNELLSSALC